MVKKVEYNNNLSLHFLRADKKLLLSWGHPESDLEQLEYAFYHAQCFCYNGECEVRIPRGVALERLGREKFMSGISRCAFHGTASRSIDDEGAESIMFDFMELYKNL